MGKATIISESGAGQYTISTSFDKTAAEVTKAKLQAILAGVQSEIDAGADGVRLIYLNARKTALSKQIARVDLAAGMTRQMLAWCADLTTELTGDVGTIEIGTEAGNGINIKPGYGGGQAYQAVSDGIETPFLTLPISTAMMNFAIMPGIQKWKPTYRYGTVSDINFVENTCTVTLEACKSSIQNIDINQGTVLTGVPVEYMSCNALAFENGDSVIVRFDGHAWADPTVIGFKTDPKPCESLFIRVQTLYGVLIYDILNKTVAIGLPDSPPSFPCEFSTEVNAWLVEHVSVSEVNTTTVSNIGAVTSYYLRPDWTIDTDRLNIDIFPDTSDWGDLVEGTRTRTESAEWDCPYVDELKSHTGVGIDATYGKMWAEAEISLTCTYNPSNNPPWLRTWNYYCESLVTTIIKYNMSRVIQATGFGDRSFIACSRASSRTENYHSPLAPYGSQYVDALLKFYSPFESAAMVESLFSYNNSESSGNAIEAYSVTVGGKRGASSMVSYCTLSYNFYDLVTGVKTAPDGLPVAKFYTKNDILSTENPNPFEDLELDQSLCSAVEQLMGLTPIGFGTAISVDFIEVS